MKSTLLLITLILSSLTSFAKTLNIPDGKCRGTGLLVSGFPIPKIEFVAERELSDGAIIAKSTVEIFGQKPSVKARIYFLPTTTNQFQVLDLDKDPGKAIAGRAMCSQTGCTFEARVANGFLFLRESLIVTAEGFEVVNGYQNLAGVESRYAAHFTCTKN